MSNKMTVRSFIKRTFYGTIHNHFSFSFLYIPSLSIRDKIEDSQNFKDSGLLCRPPAYFSNAIEEIKASFECLKAWSDEQSIKPLHQTKQVPDFIFIDIQHVSDDWIA